MVKFTAAANYAVKHTDRQDFMHSSGYAKTQNGGSFGAASTESFAVRQSIEEQRKFIKGYRNSRIMNDFYGVQRAKTVRPEAKNRAFARGKQENPMDTAVSRARFSASGDNRGSAKVARAPKVPSRRMGI